MKLYDPGEPHDRMDVVFCYATRNEHGLRHTCVRADYESPRGDFYRDRSPLFQLDVKDGYAWVWRTTPSLGEITAEQRLRLLLGEEVTVGEWTIKQA